MSEDTRVGLRRVATDHHPAASEPESAVAGPEGLEVRVREVFPYEFGVRRRERAQEDPEGPSVTIQDPAVQLGEDGAAFTVVIGSQTLFPFAEQAMLEVTASVYGTFEARPNVDIDFVRAFALTSGVRVLWPYLRSAVAEIGRMVGLPLPPLPLVITGTGPADARIESAPPGS
jgi:hypothetical protein